MSGKLRDKKIAMVSLGCPKNQVDADVLCHALLTAGHTTTADPAEADCILVNTCAFIQSAKEEAIENILECLDALSCLSKNIISSLDGRVSVIYRLVVCIAVC